MIPPPTPEALGRLKQFVLDTWVPAIGMELRSSAGTTSGPISKLGGWPFSPVGFTWPRTPEERAMEFIGQINFAEVAAQVPRFECPLPRSGLLQLFYDTHFAAMGFDPDDRNYWSLRWYPVVPPEGEFEFTESHPRLCEHDSVMSFYETYSLPGSYHAFPDPKVRDSLYSESEVEAYEALSKRQYSQSLQQLLGTPWVVQNDPRINAQLASNGIRAGNSRVRTDPRAIELRKNLSDWTLLWQIDEDNKHGLDFWGGVMLYVMIRTKDLEAGDLSRCWLIVQGT